MLDVVLGALLVGLAIRGWSRGLVREVISLGVLVIGTIAAFRLSTPVGRVLADMSGASPDVTRYIAGFVIFLLISIAAGVASHMLHLSMRFLPGVSTLNRGGGAALSLIALTLVLTLVVSMATVLELPDAVEQPLEESAVASTLTNPDGLPQRVLGFLSGDRVVEAALRIRELTGDHEAVALAAVPIELPAAEDDDLDRLPDAEDEIFDLLDRERVNAGADPLLRSSALDQIAYELGIAGYTAGSVVRLSDAELRTVLNEAGLPTTARTMVAVLAPSPEAGHAALAATMSDAIAAEGLTKAGVAVIDGPTGLLIVEVMTG